MQFIAILVSLAVSGSLIAGGLHLRARVRRRAVRPAVPGGRRRDFFGDAETHLAPVPDVAPAQAPPARHAA